MAYAFQLYTMHHSIYNREGVMDKRMDAYATRIYTHEFVPGFYFIELKDENGHAQQYKVAIQ